jgi:hypothetical protein
MKSSFSVYPVNDVGVLATPVAASQNGATGAVSATLAAAASRLTHISGFEVTFSNPTAATTITITVTNVVGGPLNDTQQLLAAGAAVPPPSPLVVKFIPPIPASALNTAIVVNVPALGAGASGVSVTAHGFQA